MLFIILDSIFYMGNIFDYMDKIKNRVPYVKKKIKLYLGDSKKYEYINKKTIILINLLKEIEKQKKELINQLEKLETQKNKKNQYNKIYEEYLLKEIEYNSVKKEYEKTQKEYEII